MTGFRAALDLLLNEDAYLAWVEGRDEEYLPLDRRRQLADFLNVVAGDGTFAGSLHGKREAIGDGHGWAAPSTHGPESVPSARVWHAIEVPSGRERQPGEDWNRWVRETAVGEPEPACGHGTLRIGQARPVNEIPSTASRCTQAACQKRLVG